MTLSTNAAVVEDESQGWQTTISDSSAIADGVFNAGTNTAFVLTDKAPFADVVLEVTMASAPAAGAAFHLYLRDMLVDGTNPAPVPDNNYKSRYVGSFALDLVNTIQRVPLEGIRIKSNQEFRIENDTGVSTSGTTAVKIKAQSYNAKV